MLFFFFKLKENYFAIFHLLQKEKGKKKKKKRKRKKRKKEKRKKEEEQKEEEQKERKKAVLTTLENSLPLNLSLLRRIRTLSLSF